jgi:radical SAM/Cys-rich protein
MRSVLVAAHLARPKLVDITGGAPELNPCLRKFIRSLREEGHKVQVRTNLTVLLELGMGTTMRFYRDIGVKLVASLPCYLKKEVDSQRGKGVFERSLEAIRRLNGIGYGRDSELGLDLVFNPEGAFLPAEQKVLESEYREELSKFGLFFNDLLTITNMPIGRFLQLLRRRGLEGEYRLLLRSSFNPETIDKLMCRNQVNIGWDGTLYDCDFNFALGLPIDFGLASHIRDFDPPAHGKRRIVTGDHCFGCTAGHGSSCGGALVA